MRTIKRILCILLAAILILALTACTRYGGKASGKTASVASAGDTIDVIIPKSGDYVICVSAKKGTGTVVMKQS